MGAWLMSFMPATAQKSTKASNNKERCQATTQKGERCKLRVVDGSKYCSVHRGNNPKGAKCKAITQSGIRCSRAAVQGGYCSQHATMKKKGK